MTVKELITELLDKPMDDEVLLCYDKVHTDEFGDVVKSYGFRIDSVRDSRIMFTDWRDKAGSEGKD
jgi:hypothetical protein